MPMRSWPKMAKAKLRTRPEISESGSMRLSRSRISVACKVCYSVWMIESDPIRERFMSLSPHLSERERRPFAATEARAAGYSGIAAVSAATGIAPSRCGQERFLLPIPGRHHTGEIGVRL